MTSSNKKAETAKKVGRPQIEINLDLVDKLGSIHCTDEEIAAIVGVSLETFKRRKQDPAFAEMLANARAKGRGSLRRMQWQAAHNGSVPMMIFLGKNLLQQRDRFEDEPKESAVEKAKEIASALKAMVDTEQAQTP